MNHQGTDKLRRGRVSIPGARYFITVCTFQRRKGLEQKNIRDGIIEALQDLHQSADVQMYCSTVMPDHIHALFTLKNNLTLSQTQAKLKSRTKHLLKNSNLSWQDNFYDHRIRHTESMEPFARYIFLNPYRKRLLPRMSQWPGWSINRNEKPEFLQYLDDDLFPPAEWIEEEASIADLIDQDLLVQDASQT